MAQSAGSGKPKGCSPSTETAGREGENIHQTTRITPNEGQKSIGTIVFWCCGLSRLFKGGIVMNILRWWPFILFK